MCLEALLLSPLVWLPLHSLTDRKSTRLNSSHSQISYAVFCLKKKKSHIPDGHKHPTQTEAYHKRECHQHSLRRYQSLSYSNLMPHINYYIITTYYTIASDIYE